ncbi:hypothetical protein ACLGIH_15045 [Streptomyces sp. HMX87]|uniref:hypothetical protein n=1 Tax=Streptomyces sp. HMX87 TaxID=3390849 RepID=UPI003A837BB5
MNDDRKYPEAELSEALRRAADGLPLGPAPVDAVVRAGRARRRRHRAVLSGAAALTVLAALAGTAVLGGLPPLSGSPLPDHVEPAVTAPASPSPAGPGLRTVQPYEPATLTPDLRLGLLPEGRQNYVITEAERFPEAVEYARSARLGHGLRRRSISVGYDSSAGRGVQRLDGAWRLTEAPRRIVVTVAGVDHRAELFTLPGRPGWGVYFLDTAGLPRFTSFRVTAYDEDGEVFDTVDVDAPLQGAGEPTAGG